MPNRFDMLLWGGRTNAALKNKARIAALALLITTGFNTRVAAQASFESITSGAWNSASTWTMVAGTDADGRPDANDNVRIRSGHNITTGNANRDCANLVIDASGILTVDNTNNVRINANPGSATINGTVVMSSSGRLLETGNGTRTLNIGSGGKLTISGGAGNPTFDIYSFDVNSTVEYTANANQTVQSKIVYGKLTLGGTGKKTVGPLPTDTTFTCAGKLTIGSGVTFDVSTNILYINLNGDVENNGTLDASVGTTVLKMRGALWTNNGVHLPSTTPGFGHQPTTTFFNTQIGGTTAVQRFYDVIIDGTSNAMVSIDSARNFEIKPGAAYHKRRKHIPYFISHKSHTRFYIGISDFFIILIFFNLFILQDQPLKLKRKIIDSLNCRSSGNLKQLYH